MLRRRLSLLEEACLDFCCLELGLSLETVSDLKEDGAWLEVGLALLLRRRFSLLRVCLELGLEPCLEVGGVTVGVVAPESESTTFLTASSLTVRSDLALEPRGGTESLVVGVTLLACKP